MSEHRLIFGTHTADGEPNFLILAHVNLPLEGAEGGGEARDREGEEEVMEGYAGGTKLAKDFGEKRKLLEVAMKIPHEGEVNRCFRPTCLSVVSLSLCRCSCLCLLSLPASLLLSGQCVVYAWCSAPRPAY